MSEVKLTSNGLLQGTHILVGDEELRATSITVRIDNNENMRAKLTIETYADLIDVPGLEKDTEIIITPRKERKSWLSKIISKI